MSLIILAIPAVLIAAIVERPKKVKHYRWPDHSKSIYYID